MEATSAGLVDAVVRLKDAGTGASICGGRTYTSETSNSWKVIIMPGTYDVTVRGLGDFKDQVENFTV